MESSASIGIYMAFHPITSILATVAFLSGVLLVAVPRIPPGRAWLSTESSHWQTVGKLFHPTALRLLVPWFAILPILLKVLSDVPETLTFMIADRGFQVATRLPFKWYALWLSSFFYAVAWAIYLTRCPAFIRD